MAALFSSLQLTLNLHNFRYIFRRKRDLAGEDYKQDVYERVSRNVRQFSEQVAPPVEQIEYRYSYRNSNATYRRAKAQATGRIFSYIHIRNGRGGGG